MEFLNFLNFPTSLIHAYYIYYSMKFQALISFFLFASIKLISSEEEEVKFPSNTPVIMLTEDNFDEETGLGISFKKFLEIGRRPIKIPWFIYFYTPWCPACRRMVPIWEEIARRYQGSVNIAAIERYNLLYKTYLISDENYMIKDRIGVEHFPTFMYFAENNKMYKFDGNLFIHYFM